MICDVIDDNHQLTTLLGEFMLRAVTIIHCNSRNIINKNTMMFNRSIVGAAVAFVAGASSTSAFAPSSCE